MGSGGDGAGYCRVDDSGCVDWTRIALVSDEISTGGGAAAHDVQAQRDVTMRDRLHDQRGGSVTFQSQDNAILWQAIIELGNSISSVREKLDDLPNRVAKLEVQFQPVPMPLPIIYPPLWAVLSLTFVIVVIAAFFVGAYLLGG